jgi:hypothetical protein
MIWFLKKCCIKAFERRNWSISLVNQLVRHQSFGVKYKRKLTDLNDSAISAAAENRVDRLTYFLTRKLGQFKNI